MSIDNHIVIKDGAGQVVFERLWTGHAGTDTIAEVLGRATHHLHEVPVTSEQMDACYDALRNQLIFLVEDKLPSSVLALAPMIVHVRDASNWLRYNKDRTATFCSS